MKPFHATVGLIASVALVGCMSMPTGPTRMVLPGTGKTFEQFRFDDAECRRYAFEQIGGTTAERAANEAAVRSAVVGTVVGAAAGAAIDGHNGAGVGAGTGLLMGSAIGMDTGQRSGYGTQHQYDNAYVQCMYARGHRVPVPAGMAHSIQQGPASYPPPVTTDGVTIPAPPSGNPPPPPPGH